MLAVEIVRGDAKRQGAWQPADMPEVEFSDAVAAMPVPTGSGNSNPLRIGASPNGGYNFDGEFREVGIYRRVLTGAEIKALSKGEVVAGALVSVPPPANAPPHLVARRGEKFLELPSSADVDFQEDFTLAASIKPDALADNARLIDRTTMGTMDGYLLDYLQGGKVLRLLTPWGIAQGPVNVQAGQWQHVAATCTASGLMRVYLNGAMVAETQGRKPAAPPALEATVDFRKLAAFHRALVKAGLQDTYEASMARTALQMLAARQTRIEHPVPPPALEAIPPCNPQAVDTLYFNTASWIAGGLLDRLASRSLWREPVTPGILDAARECGLLGEPAGSGDKITDWNGFKRLNFPVSGKSCFITQPAIAAPGKPWVWRTSFPDFHAEVDLELLRYGWAVAYIECLELIGCDAALDLMDHFYTHITEQRGFARKAGARSG